MPSPGQKMLSAALHPRLSPAGPQGLVSAYLEFQDNSNQIILAN